MSEVKGKITITDQATGVFKTINKQQSIFRKATESVRKQLIKTWDRKYSAKFNDSAFKKSADKIKNATKGIKQKLVIVATMKDNVVGKIKDVGTKLKGLSKIVISPLVKIRNGVGQIAGQVKNVINKAFIGVGGTLLAGGAVIGSALKQGMELEQQQISIKHFIRATSKGISEDEVNSRSDSFLNELRHNANTTPFETDEVIGAGSRALAIASGNTKEAMDLVRLAEDMAAASGGTKDISQAIEALADAKLGEMTRLKEFGFKVGKEEFDKKGFQGVAKDLSDFYGGAAEKLSQSASGLMSTITGGFKSIMADVGIKISEKLKPVLQSLIKVMDKSTPIIVGFSEALADNIGKGIEFVVNNLPKIASAWDSVKTVIVIGISYFKSFVTQNMPLMKNSINTAFSMFQKAVPIVRLAFKLISNILSTIVPIIIKIINGLREKFTKAMDFIASKSEFIEGVWQRVFPVISSLLETSWFIIEPILDIAGLAFETLFNVVEKVFPAIQSTIETVWGAIKPIVEKVGEVMKELVEKWEILNEKLSGKVNIKAKFEKAGWGITTSENKNAQNSKLTKKFKQNERGTNNWQGGLSWVGENGAELIDIPKGARILPNKESVKLSNGTNNQNQIITLNIAKLAESIVVKEEADIDKIGTEIARKVKLAMMRA